MTRPFFWPALGAATVASALAAPPALAQTPVPTETTVPTPAPSPSVKVTASGYVEALYSFNFGEPSNGVTAFRAFDDRHDTFTLSNVAVGVTAEKGPMTAKLTLQAGHTPSTYYLAEPDIAGAGGTGSSSRDLWKYVQEAWAGYRAPVGSGLTFQAGLFLSPIGPEGMAVKDDWNWSRSTLFFALPAYHTGVRASYDLSASANLTVATYNGWNSVTDGNTGKSVSAQLQLKGARNLTASLLYFGGSERPTGAPEGQPWRNLLDAWASLDATERLQVMAHADGGLETNAFGRSSWLGTALYARYRLTPVLFGAVRGDVFWERVPEGAAPIFYGAARVVSGTATLELRPLDGFSVRLEGRADAASAPLYFKGDAGGGANARSQVTVTLGVVAWF